ncbi:putative 2-dehydro-3-deoxygluconokinase [Selenomonas ruminantium subsp. lactilytica TAM6421]|uniref:Putative 2-dehydro-3-deoxygluconokinase n=1 Tax=Selenomonas ruminantium subsp. lactilytica (strain NBRC 103574 / TAM6421) TaxID=927704 RepID=I0GM64_SELRL|nr:sugar kinase [Selenomonas ruminantium]BAL81851.1 putative 2-dehydro-3-deoxygluconokinase [Selenomonas ruminantium subsp. lactilytica TAM6421]
MAEVLTIGEPMGLFVAEEAKPLKDVQTFTRLVCGAEVNFSIGLSRLGHTVSYVSRVGSDPIGQHIRDFLQENGIEAGYVQVDREHLTGMQFKEKAPEGVDPLVVNYRRHTAFSYFTPEDLHGIDWQGVRHVHVTGIPAALSASCCAAVEKLMDEAHAHQAMVSFDPNLRPALWPSHKVMVRTLNRLAAKADLVLPGLGEGKILTGMEKPEQVADFYLERGAKAVVIKLGGSKGAYGKERNGKEFIAPSFRVEHVVDTVGAGDGFAVGTVSALLEGRTLEEAALRGAAIGALAIMSAGDNEGLPNRTELQHFMEAV